MSQFFVASELGGEVLGPGGIELVHDFDELGVVGKLGVWNGPEELCGMADVFKKEVCEACEVGVALGPFLISVVDASGKEAESDIEAVVQVAATLFEKGAEGDVWVWFMWDAGRAVAGL
jgi:hypothetical protein